MLQEIRIDLVDGDIAIRLVHWPEHDAPCSTVAARAAGCSAIAARGGINWRYLALSGSTHEPASWER
jgi:hypothetical protein